MDYGAIRHLHIGCVTLSIGLFVLRAGMQFSGIDWRRWRWLRIAPHTVDSVLLGSAIVLAMRSAQYPVQQHWLSAKVLALLLYIAAGSLALRPTATRQTRVAAFVLALLTFCYIVAVAMTRSATPGWR